jgi:hypothetical protein
LLDICNCYASISIIALDRAVARVRRLLYNQKCNFICTQWFTLYIKPVQSVISFPSAQYLLKLINAELLIGHTHLLASQHHSIINQTFQA